MLFLFTKLHNYFGANLNMIKSLRLEVNKKSKENDMECGILTGVYFAPIPYRIFRLSEILRNWLCICF